MITKELLIQWRDAFHGVEILLRAAGFCMTGTASKPFMEAIASLQVAIDQPEPELEPVATIHVNHINGEPSAILFNRRTLHHGDLLYTHPAPDKPTVPDQMQDWAGMDGAIAFHLIERHADNWADTGKMMGEWLEANQAAPAKPLTDEQIEFNPDSDCEKTHHECEAFDICKAAGCCMGA